MISCALVLAAMRVFGLEGRGAPKKVRKKFVVGEIRESADDSECAAVRRFETFDCVQVGRTSSDNDG